MALGALGACSMPRPPEQRVIDSYLADPRDLANVRRVMVLPFAEEPGVDDCTQMRDIYVAELQKLRRFDIVPLPGSALEVDELNRSVRHGRLSTDAVVRLCDRYHLDGVLVGTVTSFRAYTPPILGMRTQLVSVHSGAIVWAVDAIYDSSDGYELDLIAPSKFCAYVAHRFVGTWAEG
jgi:hypothetical protein